MDLCGSIGRKRPGFTLIELLVVVAIVGLLAGLLIPVFQVSLQKTKQKATMTDIGNVAKAMASYVTDFGSAPSGGGGPLTPGTGIYTALAPFHIQAIASGDRWGIPLQVWTGLDCAGHFGIDAAELGSDDFLIQSTGRDGRDEGYTYDPADPSNCFFLIQTMTDFDRDLIMWSGNWIRAPKHTNMRS